MIKKFQRWFRLPFRSLRDHSVAASDVLMIKKHYRWFILIPPPCGTINFLFYHQVKIVMNKNQSKQVTGCSNLVVVLDLHEIALASNSTL